MKQETDTIKADGKNIVIYFSFLCPAEWKLTPYLKQSEDLHLLSPILSFQPVCPTFTY